MTSPKIESNIKRQYKVALVGTEGTGKTCFLAGCAFLGLQANEKTAFKLFSQDKRSKDYLLDLVKTLQTGSWIPATGLSTFLDFTLVDTKQNASVHLLTLDYPGEDFRKAFNELEPRDREIFINHLEESDVVLLLLGADDLENISCSETQTAMNEKLKAQLQSLWEVNESGKTAKRTINLAVIVTKSDRIAELRKAAKKSDHGQSAAKRYVIKRLGRFMDNLRSVANIKKVAYFPVSAVGTTVENQPDTNLQPFGYDAVFHWIEEKTIWKGWNRTITAAVAIIFVLTALSVAGFFGWTNYIAEQERKYDALLNDSALSIPEKLERPQSTFIVTKAMDETRGDFLRNTVAALKQRLNNAIDENALAEIREELNRLEKAGIGGFEDDVRRMKDDIDGRFYENEYQRVKQAFESKSDTFVVRANKFLESYPNASYSEEVREWQRKYSLNLMVQTRRRIGEFAVTNKSNLLEKGKRINDFVRDYEEQLLPAEKNQMILATGLAKKFAEGSRYRATLKQFGGFAYNEDIEMYLTIGKNPPVIVKSIGKVKTANPAHSFDFSWQSGDPVKLELKAKGGILYGGLETAASSESAQVDAITLLHGRTPLTVWSNVSWDWSMPKRMAPGGYFMVGEMEGIKPEEWKAFDDYIKPGNKWREGH